MLKEHERNLAFLNAAMKFVVEEASIIVTPLGFLQWEIPAPTPSIIDRNTAQMQFMKSIFKPINLNRLWKKRGANQQYCKLPHQAHNFIWDIDLLDKRSLSLIW